LKLSDHIDKVAKVGTPDAADLSTEPLVATCKHGNNEYITGTMCPECAAEQKEAENAARTARFEAQNKARQDAIRERNRPIYEGLAAAAIARGAKAEFQPENNRLIIDGVEANYQIEIKEDWTGSAWKPKPTGKLRIIVGDYGHKRQYPQRKDGSFNYADAVLVLIAYAAERKRIKAVEAQKADNKTVAAELIKTLGISNYNLVRIDPSASPDKPIRLALKGEFSMTVEDATKLVTALQSLGLKL